MGEPRLLLVGGVDRSGTTMLGAALGSAAGATVVPESQFLIELIKRGDSRWQLDEVLEVLASSWRFDLWGVDLAAVRSKVAPRSQADHSSLTHVVDVYATAARLYGERTDQPWSGLIVDHTPSNCRYALQLQDMFGIAGLVHVVRDGRAVWNSMRSLKWGASTPSIAAQYWMSRLVHGLLLESAAATGRPALGFPVCRARYEVLVDPDAGAPVESLLAELGIEDRSAGDAEARFAVPQYSEQQHSLVAGELDQSRARAWEALPDNEIRRFEAVGGEVLDLLGYERRFPAAGGYRSRWMIEDGFRDLWTQQVGGRIDSIRRQRRSRRSAE